MSYLDWKGRSLRLQVSVRSESETQLHLFLRKKELQELLDHLKLIFPFNSSQGTPALAGVDATELRLVLSEHWVLFWKERVGTSRAMLAHPSQEQWVGTLALEIQLAKKFLESLSALEPEKTIALSQFADSGWIGPFSNLDLSISFESENGV